MSSISVVIAVKNEEKNIRRCIESVLWADEIVVVDDISKDNTLSILKDYPARVIQNDSKRWFHTNKNLGIKHATKEWILSIDADEVVTPELRDEIKEAIKNPRKKGYYLNRKNFFLNRWVKGCGWWPDYVIRLFRRGAAEWPIEDFHGTPRIEDKKALGRLNNAYLHYSYASFEQYFRKFNLYTSNLALEAHKKGKRVCWYNYPYYFLILPAWIFLRKYVFSYGFIDGFVGLFISVSASMVIIVSYAKLWERLRVKSIEYRV